MSNSNNIVIHIDEALDSLNREKLSNNICQLDGVVSADVKGNRPHLMIVGYNPVETKPVDVVMGVRKTGVHAQLVAWL